MGMGRRRGRRCDCEVGFELELDGGGGWIWVGFLSGVGWSGCEWVFDMLTARSEQAGFIFKQRRRSSRSF